MRNSEFQISDRSFRLPIAEREMLIHAVSQSSFHLPWDFKMTSTTSRTRHGLPAPG